MRPLYDDLANDTGLQRPDNGNAGLWYDKFCNQWRRNPEKCGPADWSMKPRGQEPVNPKLAWIKTVCGKIGDEHVLAEIQDRQATLLETLGGRALMFRTTAPFVTGLGRGHPVENGFAWHHSLGVPYLPGSSVKGMVRAYVEQWRGGNPSADDIQHIFGPKGGEARRQAATGSVIFLDALPIRPLHLKADVMTPHYAPYYQDATGETPPADWHSPVPIPFLVVATGSTFQFGLLPRRAEDGADCVNATEWLEQALEWLGAGAKTAVGYGRMEQDSAALSACAEARAKRRQQAREDSMGPEEKRIEEVRAHFVEDKAAGRNDPSGRLANQRVALLREALTWDSAEWRGSAADLIEETVRFIPWGKKSRDQHREDLARLRGELAGIKPLKPS